ncbi:MAG TPA: 5'-nucleotidase C-terminal domain-containing protein, partial [Saprospiraceae bacterium]|nr:5'-nucleotidase C-terminal domain-containing protein [Saprospiraceae bacterium]
ECDQIRIFALVMSFNKFFFAIWIGLLISCTTVQHVSKMEVSYDVPSRQTNPATDQVIHDMITPYKVQLDAHMNDVIATLDTELSKAQPESTMGDWITDAMMAGIAREGLKADFATHNYGGMRVPVITTGPLTIGEIYELSPFDNTLMIVDVPGNIVDSLFQYIAARNGWPVSNNVRMVIKGGKVASCLINDKPVDSATLYKVAVPDYVANGGDDARFMIGLSRLQTGYLVRDMLIQYAMETTRQGQHIHQELQGRIINQH